MLCRLNQRPELYIAAFAAYLNVISLVNAFSTATTSTASICKTNRHHLLYASTTNVETITSNGGATSPPIHIIDQFLSQYKQSLDEGYKYATEFGFTEENDANEDEEESSSPEGAFYALFSAIRKMDSTSSDDDDSSSSSDKLLGLSGTPFYIPAALLAKAEGAEETNQFTNFFHYPHLATALEEDFLDAQRGSTDNRKGWQVSEVSQPMGSSFDDARMTLQQVATALEVSSFLYSFFMLSTTLYRIGNRGSHIKYCTPILHNIPHKSVWYCYIQQHWRAYPPSCWTNTCKYRCNVSSWGIEYVCYQKRYAYLRSSPYRSTGRSCRTNGGCETLEGIFVTI